MQGGALPPAPNSGNFGPGPEFGGPDALDDPSFPIFDDDDNGDLGTTVPDTRKKSATGRVVTGLVGMIVIFLI